MSAVRRGAVDVDVGGLEDDHDRVSNGNLDLGGLTEREREVWVSCEVEGLRPVDLAPYLDVSASTVRTLLSRAREKRGGRR